MANQIICDVAENYRCEQAEDIQHAIMLASSDFSAAHC